MADSWLIDGDCTNCRRKTYCSKPCKKATIRRNRALYNSTMEYLGIAKILDKAGGNIREKVEANMRASGFKF